MAKVLKITLLIVTLHFSFTFCHVHLDPEYQYRSRVLGSGRLQMQKKASDLTELYTSEFLTEFEDRFDGHSDKKVQEPKVPHQWQAEVDTHPKNKRVERKQIEDEPEKREKTRRKGWKKKEESEEVEDNNSTSSQKIEAKISMRKGRHSRHSEKSEGKHHEQKKTEEQQNCNQKCFTPQCKVECTGEQVSAACSAPRCRALTQGQDSASLCSGEYCHALCFKEECISGCEGIICFVKCHGKKCHAVSEGPESGSTCVKDGCMAYGNGNRSQTKCEGESCQAQCVGEKCISSCIGIKCVAVCTGKDCKATCEGKHCKKLEQFGMLTEDFAKGSSEEIIESKKGHSDEGGYYGNKHFNDKQKPAYSESEIANKYEIKNLKLAGNNDNNKDGKVRVDYEVDIRLTPSLVMFIRDKIHRLIKLARYLQF